MRSRIVGWLIVIGAILALPVVGYAQQSALEAALSGTVRDATGGVLPGVTVVAVNAASGNTFEAATDALGAYRIPVRIGVYRITAELTGFRTIIRTGVEVLVGQQVVVDLQMAVSTVEESVTVTGEAPLIDVTSSTLGTNIDPRQMQELPVNGRNWMDLSLLAPGSRQNAATEVPQDRQGYFQVNVDGQQVTQMICCAQQQPRYSKDAIAEFEIVTNRFDATVGRSAGMVVNAITRAGTNTPSGTVSGYFRHDNFNAADFIQERVVPYQNQQAAGTFGGPIRRDRIHYFGNYEYEREPKTTTFSSPYPAFNVDLSGTRREHKGGGRVDVQFTPRTRLAVREASYYQFIPNDNTGGASQHPSSSRSVERYSDQVFGTLTRVLGNRAVNEVKVGLALFDWNFDPDVFWAGGRFPNAKVRDGGSVRLNFTGYAIGTATNTPQALGQNRYSIRDDLTVSFTRGGRHDLKAGGEYLYSLSWLDWCNRCNGSFESTARPPANIEQLIPVWNDASTWNLAPLSPLMQRYHESFADGSFYFETPRHLYAAWAQDDWHVTPRLTLNLGVRWDFDYGGLGENIPFLPWRSGNDPSDTDNIAPRLGFAFSLNDRTVIRGGYGKFFTELENDPAHQTKLWNVTAIPERTYDGRADFAVNPHNGPAPTYAQVIANACDNGGLRPGCFRRDITIEIPSPETQISYSHQTSIGVQRQLGDTMAFTADYVFTGGRLEETRHNVNLSYNPATGANYPFRDISRRPFPEWGVVLLEFMDGWSNYHGLETSFTKRMSNRWQASATYSFSGFRDSGGFNGGSPPRAIDFANGRPVERALGFDVARDLGPDYALAENDQRHRAVFNGIWQVGYGFQLSGLYFFGSGQRFSTQYGGDRRDLGIGGTRRLRPDGAIAPPNAVVGDPLHRVDLRVQRRFRLGGRATVDGIVEVFNLFNHENYGSYVTQESNRNYGQPAFNASVAYQPRMMQLGFRVAF